MTNETQEARALLESQIAACAAAQERFGKLKEVLQKDVSGEGVSAAAIAAERSLADIRGIERRQKELLERTGQADIRGVLAKEPNIRERLAAEKLAATAVQHQQALRDSVQLCQELLQNSVDFISYQLNVISGTVADHTSGKSQPIAGTGGGVSREIAMFDADV